MNNAANEMQWVNERVEIKTSAERALNRCKKREERLLKNGYRWHNVGKITQILIPCDKYGHPTKQGAEKLEMMKKHLGI